VLFVIAHLLGNLTLLSSNPDLFNSYAKKLEDLGALLIVAEVGLILMFGLHILNGFWLKKTNLSARPVAYSKWQSKGAAQSSKSSRNMALTGTILLIFLILHIVQFKFGPSIESGYIAELNGGTTRDLYRLVFETFQNPAMVVLYVGVMIFLGMHVKHGFWSALQSMGLLSSRNSRTTAWIGYSIALILAVGFIALPVWLYFNLGAHLR
jgi:succinate dehydrogenase / fumarate reductase cytochrome b subunit